MYNFSDNTATDQHDHGHGHDTAGLDVGPKAHKNSTSETTHGKKEPKQHKEEKEPKDMTSTFKNSITPVLAALAVAMTFLLAPVCNASGVDQGKLKEERFSNTASVGYDVKDFGYDNDVRLDDGKQFTRSGDEKVVRDDESKLAGGDGYKLKGSENNKFADVGGADRVCMDNSWCAGIGDGEFFNFKKDNFASSKGLKYDSFGDNIDYSRAEKDKLIDSKEMTFDGRVDVKFERPDAKEIKGNDDGKNIKDEDKTTDDDRSKSADDYGDKVVDKAVDGGWGKCPWDNRKDLRGFAEAIREEAKVAGFGKGDLNVLDIDQFARNQDKAAGDFVMDNFSQDDFDNFAF